MNVLIVDDSKIVRRVLSNTLPRLVEKLEWPTLNLFEAEDVQETKLAEGEGLDYFDEDIMPITTHAYLYLSGTPFRAIESGEFIEEQIFNWTYSDEQKAKVYDINLQMFKKMETARKDNQGKSRKEIRKAMKTEWFAQLKEILNERYYPGISNLYSLYCRL